MQADRDIGRGYAVHQTLLKPASLCWHLQLVLVVSGRAGGVHNCERLVLGPL